MTTDKPNIYVGECTLISNDYTGKALTISMKGCALSTTHISMTLDPDQQKVLREYLMKDVVEELERKKTLQWVAKTDTIQFGFDVAIQLIKRGVRK
jgi:hypothetical protein